MNVFEDLIEELKEENLLEETVIETTKLREPESLFQQSVSSPVEAVSPAPLSSQEYNRLAVGSALTEADIVQESAPVPIPSESDSDALHRAALEFDVATPAELEPELAQMPQSFEIPAPVNEAAEIFGVAAFEPQATAVSMTPEAAFANLSMPEMPQVPVVLDSPEFREPIAPPPMPAVVKAETSPLLAPPPGRTSFTMEPMPQGRVSRNQIVSQKEYFKKRAIDEVTGLQMVDHVLSGVEREQMKIVPKPFDDIPVKKALHDFMQVSGDTKSAAHARAEFQLMQETESWYSSLSHRDRHVSVAHLRRYCETTKPALSPQALIAMARFYRNSPFSEQVRNKFDLIITRLFSSEIENDSRELLFPREELIAQVKDLYAEWSSIQLYSAAEDDSEVLIAVLKFQDFVNEAESTATFDELIGNDFFNRLRLFKESLHENFFAPLITVASVEANVKIGNRYVQLIQRERKSPNAAALEEKYGFLHDQAISDSTGKTYHLVDLLKERAKTNAAADLKEVRVNADAEPVRYRPKKQRHRIWAVNKWLLGFAVITLLACGALYFWAEMKTQEVATAQSSRVKRVNLDNSSLKEVLLSASINEETFYGVAKNTWTDLTLDKKEETLKKILSIGPEKGFKKVHILNEKGRAVGFAAEDKLEVYNP